MKTGYSQLLVLLFSFISIVGYSQGVPQGITYQGLARSSSSSYLISQPISIKVGIYSPTVLGTKEWEETHTVTTNQVGVFYCVIGQGSSTGSGSLSSFSSINWGAGTHFIKISMDETGGSSYVDIDTIQFWSVPYAMYSGNAASVQQPGRLSQMLDVDTIGVFTGAVLKWNGSLWLPSADNDSDTASYAFNAGHSSSSDTALFATNVLSTVDTVQFSYFSDSSLYSSNSSFASSSQNSNYCDTATYALNSGSAYTYWNLTGNAGTIAGTNFLGTIDNKDLVIKTNGLERARITASGNLGIGITNPSATVHIVGNDGLLAEGTYGSGVIPTTGVGTRMMWYPKKAAFRAGGVSANVWDDVNIGIYSFAGGYDSKASGAYSTVFGYNSIASGAYSFAACQDSKATALSSIAMGTTCYAPVPYSIALGRGSQATDTSSFAIGYHPYAIGKYAFAFGHNTRATGDYSYTFGYHADANYKKGSFVYADGSSAVATLSTADNQFMVRASGGVILYSNTALTSGVSLPAGGGSWASVSDKNKKENFKRENPLVILDKINQMEVSSWNYKTQSSAIRHIGPMAQDFYGLFKFGESDTTITTIDVDGVSLLAIQGLAIKTAELKEKSMEVEKLKQQVANLERDKKKLERRLSQIEETLEKSNFSLTAENK